MSETHSVHSFTDVKTSCLKRQHTEITPDALLYRKTRLTGASCSAKTAQELKHNLFSPALLKSVLKNLTALIRSQWSLAEMHLNRQKSQEATDNTQIQHTVHTVEEESGHLLLVS